MTVGFALCGSFCTYGKVFPVMEALADRYCLLPILSEASGSVDSRFGNAADHIQRVT